MLCHFINCLPPKAFCLELDFLQNSNCELIGYLVDDYLWICSCNCFLSSYYRLIYFLVYLKDIHISEFANCDNQSRMEIIKKKFFISTFATRSTQSGQLEIHILISPELKMNSSTKVNKPILQIQQNNCFQILLKLLHRKSELI